MERLIFMHSILCRSHPAPRAPPDVMYSSWATRPPSKNNHHLVSSRKSLNASMMTKSTWSLMGSATVCNCQLRMAALAQGCSSNCGGSQDTRDACTCKGFRLLNACCNSSACVASNSSSVSVSTLRTTRALIPRRGDAKALHAQSAANLANFIDI